VSAIPQITQITKEKAESAKAFIEKKYQKLKCDEKERKEGKYPIIFFIWKFILSYFYSLGYVI